MIAWLALMATTLPTAAALPPADPDIVWEHYFTYESFEYEWAPAQSGTAVIDGREYVTVLARSTPVPEERRENEPTSLRWRFAIDCAADRIAIIEYSSGKHGEFTRHYVFDPPEFKRAGNPPGGAYETELTALACTPAPESAG